MAKKHNHTDNQPRPTSTITLITNHGQQAQSHETFHDACQRQMMGLHHGPDGPSTAELLTTTGQVRMADLWRHAQGQVAGACCL